MANIIKLNVLDKNMLPVTGENNNSNLSVMLSLFRGSMYYLVSVDAHAREAKISFLCNIFTAFWQKQVRQGCKQDIM